LSITTVTTLFRILSLVITLFCYVDGATSRVQPHAYLKPEPDNENRETTGPATRLIEFFHVPLEPLTYFHMYRCVVEDVVVDDVNGKTGAVVVVLFFSSFLLGDQYRCGQSDLGSSSSSSTVATQIAVVLVVVVHHCPSSFGRTLVGRVRIEEIQKAPGCPAKCCCVCSRDERGSKETSPLSPARTVVNRVTPGQVRIPGLGSSKPCPF
jgi:hypothetical protein